MSEVRSRASQVVPRRIPATVTRIHRCRLKCGGSRERFQRRLAPVSGSDGGNKGWRLFRRVGLGDLWSAIPAKIRRRGARLWQQGCRRIYLGERQ
jgi:hypothetical protein